MVLRTRTSCSFRWRACIEPRCPCRSTNISERSRLEYVISYILLLAPNPSTENAECGVLPSSDHPFEHRLHHVALPARRHAYFYSSWCIRHGECGHCTGGGSDRGLVGGRRRRQHPLR